MAKKTKGAPISVTPTVHVPSVIFPAFSSKKDLECRVLLEDQILLVDVCPIADLVLPDIDSSKTGVLLS